MPDEREIAVRAEAEAEQRLERAVSAAFEELEGRGVTGKARLMEMNARVEPLRKEYENKKFARMLAERDRKMLQRGTRRGFAIVLGILCFLWGSNALTQAITNESGGYVPVFSRGRDPEWVGDRWVSKSAYRRYQSASACLGLVLSGACFWSAWSLGKIPILGEEEGR